MYTLLLDRNAGIIQRCDNAAELIVSRKASGKGKLTFESSANMVEK